MQPIAPPQVLDPDRILADDRGNFTVHHQAREQLLDEALHATCSYAQQLWHDLEAVRAHLLDSLPPDPRTPGPHPTASAAPTGPDDDTGWNNWITVYATVTSVLCGPHGDAGFGLSEGRREANLRRTPTVPRTDPEPADQPARDSQTRVDSADPEPRDQARSRPKRAAAIAILILLAARGLRPRRRP